MPSIKVLAKALKGVAVSSHFCSHSRWNIDFSFSISLQVLRNKGFFLSQKYQCFMSNGQSEARNHNKKEYPETTVSRHQWRSMTAWVKKVLCHKFQYLLYWRGKVITKTKLENNATDICIQKGKDVIKQEDESQQLGFSNKKHMWLQNLRIRTEGVTTKKKSHHVVKLAYKTTSHDLSIQHHS